MVLDLPLQQERVGDDHERRKAHEGPRDGGGEADAEAREQSTGGQRDGNDVVPKGPEQVLLDLADCALAQVDRVRDL